MSFEERIRRVNSYCLGWLGYFQLAKCKSFLQKMEGWIRRKLRCVRLKQCKRTKTLAEFFINLGVKEFRRMDAGSVGKRVVENVQNPDSASGNEQ